MMRLRRGHFLCIFIALLLSLSMLFYPELGGEAALSASVDETTPLAEAQSQSPVLSSVYWGDSENDGMRYYDVTSKAFYCDIAVNGSDIYIATTTDSYGAGGVDFAILHYTMAVAQPSLTISQVSPPDKATIPYTPIELRVDVTSEGTGIEGAAVTFYLDDKPIEEKVDDIGGGIYRVFITPTSGSNSWYATAEKTGYSPATSDTKTFTYGTPPVTQLRCTLVSPSNGSSVTTSYIELKVRVTSDGEPIKGASVYFYFDGEHDWTCETDSNGYAVPEKKRYLGESYGTHSWYAIATKEGYTPTTSDMWSFTYTKVAEGEEHTYVVFQEDFEDGEAGDWEIRIEEPESVWAVELDEGNHVLSEEGHIWAEAGDFAWTDYTFEVKVKLLNPYQGAHINFRMSTPAGSRYFLRWFFGGLSLRKERPSGTFSDLKAVKVDIDLNTWYTLKIVCVGKSIEAYVDDVLRLDYVDDENPLLSGRIGLEGILGGHFHFDDVKVSTKPMEEGAIPTSLSCQISPHDLTEGDSVTVSGHISPAMEVEVAVEFRHDGDVWTFKTFSDPDGGFSYTWTPPQPGGFDVEVHWPGDEEYEPSSWVDTLDVRPKGEGLITTTLSCQLSSHEITEGSSITVTGTINPAITKEVLIVFSYDGEEWKFGVSPGPDGRFFYTWKPPNLGEFGMEVHWPGDERYEASDWFETFSVRSGEGPPPPTGPPIAIQYIISPAIIFILVIAVAVARRRRRPPPMVTPAPPIPPSPIEARLSKVRDALERLGRMRRQGKLSAMVYEDLKREYEAELKDLEGRLRRGR